MRRSTAYFLALSIAAAFGGCGFTPMGSVGTNGSSGAANSTGTVTGTGNSTGSGNSSGGGNNSGSSNIDSNCGAVNRGATAVNPDVLIIQDASGSMNDDLTDAMCQGGCGANSKWAQVTAPLEQVVMSTEMNINWGLKMFADDSNCTVNPTVNVSVGPMRAQQITNAIMSRTSANGGIQNGSRTPTRAAIAAGASYLMGLTSMGDTAPKYMVLATDGLPNCPQGGNSSNDDSAAAIKAVGDAYAAGIPVFVIGVATAGTTMNGAVNADQTLSMMANAGGLPRQGSPSYYTVSSGQDLINALSTLVGVVASCNFALGAAPNANTSTNFIDVFGDGTKIPQDTSHQNGWDYTDSTKTAIQIYGGTCNAIMAGQIKDVTVTFRCIVG